MIDHEDLDPHLESGIGTLNEGSLHAALKRLYARAGDSFEVPRSGFVIDIVRDEDLPTEQLIEIQTGSFGALGNKFDRLLEDHQILVVHPIAVSTILERADRSGRRSPKRGSIYELLDQLVSLPTMLDHPNLELDVVLHTEVKKQIHDPSLRRRRGGWRTVDRHLVDIVETRRFRTIDDVAALAPSDLPPEFTTADIAERSDMSREAAQKLCYCLRAAGVYDVINRTKAGHVHVDTRRGV
ncbi:MAG: hypothetical protein R8J94_21200 [Acidimicrobiia bacterium]|nr:hypothetical protein [Acidimicrobiia bacterium]